MTRENPCFPEAHDTNKKQTDKQKIGSKDGIINETVTDKVNYSW